MAMRLNVSRFPRFQTILVLVALAVMLAFAARGAFYSVFGNFEPWDDEGCVMISVASCARGYALYDQVFGPYGPFYYLVAWLGFDLGPLELDHATVRWLVLFAWLALTLACCALVWRISRNVALSAIAFVVSFAHLFSLASEPGHPHSLVVLCLMLVVLLPAVLARTRPRLCCILLGVLGAAIALTKINIGVYVMLSVVLAILEHLPETAIVRWVGRASWAAAIALPCAVMHARLKEPWALHYAAAVTGTVLLIALTLRFSARAPLLLFRVRDALAFGTAFLISAALFLAFPLLRGTSLFGLLDGVLLGPLAMAVDFARELKIAESSVQSLFGAAGLWIVVQLLLRRRGRAGAIGVGLLAAARLGFGLWVLHTAWLGNMADLIEVQAPFLWLCVVPPPGEPMDPARVFLTLVAALQLLQAFPVAGSQMAWATLLLLPAATICLADAWQYLGLRARRVLPGSAVPARLGVAASVLLVIQAVELMREQEQRRRNTYDALCPLDLPGTGPLRIEEEAAATYVCLTRNIAAADAFYALPGLNSYYFWAQKDPPTTLNGGAWYALFSPHRQRLVCAALEPHQKLLVLVDGRYSDPSWLSTPDPDAKPLAYFMRASTKVLGSIGLIDVRVRRGWTPDFIDCARIEGDTVHLRVASREGRQIARIVVADYARGVVLSDSAGNADAAAWQVLDEAGAATDLGAGTWTLDLARDRHLTLRGEASLARIRGTRTPIVRLLDARSEVVARLPFLR